MKVSKVVLSVCIAFSVLSWVNSHYDPSKFNNNSYSKNETIVKKVVKS